MSTREGSFAASHERNYLRGQEVYSLEHYLDVLERKPGAFSGSKALNQWRLEGRWTEEFDRLWEQLKTRHGESAGTRAMIELLREGSRVGYERLRQAVERALILGTGEAEAVSYLLRAEELEQASPEPKPLAAEGLSSAVIKHFHLPPPEMTGYDRLLNQAAASAVAPLEAAR